MRQRVTQQEVAQQAGVTRATVSYVLSGRAEELSITPEVVSRVMEAVDSLGYTPNRAAQTLVSGKSYTVGLIVGDAAGDPMAFWTPVIEGAVTAVLRSGYDILILQNPAGPVVGAEKALETSRVDAMIAIGFTYAERVESWRKMPVPPAMVALEEPVDLPCVVLDTDEAYREALAHLRELGHREVAYARPHVAVSARTRNLRKAAAEFGLTLEEIVAGDATPQMNALDVRIAYWREHLKERLREGEPPSAILCWNDEMALALCSVLRERGLDVPEDVSVIGFDDVVATAGIPPLSTVSHELSAMGEAVAALALKMAEGELDRKEACRTTVAVPARFVPRGTTAPPKPA